ncbi:MAG: arsenite methyltransferase [Deltaproteobacteria bacterium]
MKKITKDKAKKIVREAYARVANGREERCGCGPGASEAKGYARSIGYSDKELRAIPDEANLALSCGNPTALAGLKKGEVVVDLGAGAGFDCFLAATKVGAKGRIIGVDMTPEMVEKARANAKKHGVKNIEFRLGEIENLPVADNSVDAVISNCVINLSVDKPRVLCEIRRILKRGGRIAISDVALLKELPKKIRESAEAYAGCLAGAVLVDEYENIVRAAGLKSVKVTISGASPCVDPDVDDPLGRAKIKGLRKKESIDDYAVSISVEGRK